jgi:thioredoxin reductase (NADPH)
LEGNDNLEGVVIHTKEEKTTIKTDLWFPLFGLSQKLGPIGDWGLEIDKNAIVVDTFDYQTNLPGIFAIGDVNTYPGKLKLILCGFHEATLAVQTAYKIINPDKKFTLKYTTVQGVQGFEDKQPKETVTS